MRDFLQGWNQINHEIILSKIAALLNRGKKFLLMTHKDPDVDGIGSMLALGRALISKNKEIVLLTEEPLVSPVIFLEGADKVVQILSFPDDYDAVLALDCAEKSRIGFSKAFVDNAEPLINIDHHGTNDFFGDINLVDEKSSSTGELIYRLIKNAGFPMDLAVAKNIYAAIMTDTGSFRYSNTTPLSFRIAAEMMDYGVKPWELSRRIMDEYGHARLKLLRLALDTIEFHNKGQIGIIMITREMFEATHADRADSDKFVDYPRFVSGVELAVLIRQKGENEYKFSLRSNGLIDVARLASRFGGGGHIRAAGFDADGSISDLKRKFLQEANQVLDDLSN